MLRIMSCTISSGASKPNTAPLYLDPAQGTALSAAPSI